MNFLRRSCLLLCLFAAVPAVALVVPEAPRKVPASTLELKAVQPGGETLERGDRTPLGERAEAFIAREGGSWEFQVDRRTGRPLFVQGSGIALVPGRGNSLQPQAFGEFKDDLGEIRIAAIAPLAQAFIDDHRALLAPSRGALLLNAQRSQSRLRGKLVSLYYDWRIDGVPVEGAHVFVRVNSGNITQFGAPLVGETSLAIAPSVTSQQAVRTVLAHAADVDRATFYGDPQLIIQAEPAEGDGIAYRLVWKITYHTGGIETWEGRVDAHSGAIVSFRDTTHYGRAVGGVYPRSIQYQDETVVPMHLLDVNVNGAIETTDKAGAFSYPGGVATTDLGNSVFSIDCIGCVDPDEPQDSIDVGGRIDFGVGGVDQVGNGKSTPADRNLFYHLNFVRLVARGWLPALGWLDAPMLANGNVESACNAGYNFAANSVTFFRRGFSQGIECNNTAEIADVVYHEWGHGLDLYTNGGTGGSGEGSADVNSIHITHSPEIGPGFRLASGNPVRNVDRNVSGLVTLANAGAVCGGGVHCEGQAYGQSAWELAQLLVTKYGLHTGWRVSERLFYTSLPDASSLSPLGTDPIIDAYFFADDNDGNMANGTPNAPEIYAAFNPHGMARLQRQASPPCARPTQPTLNVTPQCDSFDLSWTAVPAAVGYTVLRTTLIENQAYLSIAELAPGQTNYTDTEVLAGIDYYYIVMATNAADCESTIENPQQGQLPPRPPLALSAAIDDDLPQGNRSGFADPGETVDVVLTLKNFGGGASGPLDGTLTSPTPGVTIVDGVTAFPSLVALGQAVNADVLRFSTDDQLVACGDLLDFEFTPSAGATCASDPSFFQVRVGQPDGQGGFVCDDTPACFVPPSFDGLISAAPGGSCAEVDLAWGSAETHCLNAEISFAVYRDLTPGFTPDASNLVAAGLGSTSFTDTLLAPGQAYHYIVRAVDSRSGEESNAVERSAFSAADADLVPPVFAGIASLERGANCGENVLDWGAGLETCNTPVYYDVYRSTDPGFVPGPSTLVASTFSTSLVDAALTSGQDYTYVVRARDGAGNSDGNEVRRSGGSTLLDLDLVERDFESGTQGWQVVAPNDATTGNWEWGDPQLTGEQPDDDHTPIGVNCWITGLAASVGGGNNDIDGGTTTLVSPPYDLSGAIDPAVTYSRWFSNDRGAAPNDDPFVIEVSNNNGANWSLLEQVDGDAVTPTALEWVTVEIPLDGIVAPTNQMRFRFTAADLTPGSLVEAGIDDFRLYDQGQGCSVCSGAVDPVGTIFLDRIDGDVILDWTGDPVTGTRYAIYKVTEPVLGEDPAILIGTSETKTFVHEGAAAAGESFYYRVSAIDACGNESLRE